MKKLITLVVTLVALGGSSLNLIASESFDSSGEYLGCAVDGQQCASRASNHGYSTYHAEQSYLCPNAAKYACWGGNQADEDFKDVSVEVDSFSYCSNYVKPALCLSHQECKWTGSCVPK